MPTIVSWISFMLSWVEYEKNCITSGPSPVWTLIEDICAYIYDDKAYKNLCAGPNYESIRTLSYSFISTLDPLGQSINKYTALLGKLDRSVLAFMRGSRGDVGGPDLLENHIQCWGLKMESCFLTVGPGAHPPWQKFLDLCMALHSVLITTVQYRVCDIPVKGLWATSVRMRPLTCHLSHHFAYMKCHSSAYFIKGFSCCWVGKGEGASHCKV